MKLVGATDWFIRWPFVIEGMIVGALGGAARDPAARRRQDRDHRSARQRLRADRRARDDATSALLIAVLLGAGIAISARRLGPLAAPLPARLARTLAPALSLIQEPAHCLWIADTMLRCGSVGQGARRDRRIPAFNHVRAQAQIDRALDPRWYQPIAPPLPAERWSASEGLLSVGVPSGWRDLRSDELLQESARVRARVALGVCATAIDPRLGCSATSFVVVDHGPRSAGPDAHLMFVDLDAEVQARVQALPDFSSYGAPARIELDSERAFLHHMIGAAPGERFRLQQPVAMTATEAAWRTGRRFISECSPLSPTETHESYLPHLWTMLGLGVGRRPISDRPSRLAASQLYRQQVHAPARRVDPRDLHDARGRRCGSRRRCASRPASSPQLVELPPVAAQPPHRQHALVAVAEGDERARADHARDLAGVLRVPAALEQLGLEHEAARDVVGGALDRHRVALALRAPRRPPPRAARRAARSSPAADRRQQRAVADEVGVAADRRGEVAVARRAQAGVAEVAAARSGPA